MWATTDCLALCRTSWGIRCPSFPFSSTTIISGVLFDPRELLLPVASFQFTWLLAYHNAHRHACRACRPCLLDVSLDASAHVQRSRGVRCLEALPSAWYLSLPVLREHPDHLWHLQQARPPRCSGSIPDSYSNLVYLLDFEAHNNSLLRDNTSTWDLTPNFIILDK